MSVISWLLGTDGHAAARSSCYASLAGDPEQPRRPPELAQVEEVSQGMQQMQREEPVKWTLTMRQWSLVIDHCKTLPLYQEIQREKRFFNMYDLNRHFVTPWTANTGCGLSVMMNRGFGEPARLMVSHAWGEDVEECQAALDQFFSESKAQPETPIWFCVFANYQPQDGAGPSIGEQLALQPFKVVIQSQGMKVENGGHGMCAVHTTKEDLYDRLWCVHEVDAALAEQVEVRAAMSEQYVEEVTRRLQLFIDEGCDEDSCLRAAGINVNTCKAKCGWPADEMMLIRIVQEKGGFNRLDAVVAGFRKAMLPYDVAQQLKYVAGVDRLEVACSQLKSLTRRDTYKIEHLLESFQELTEASKTCEALKQAVASQKCEALKQLKPKRLLDLLAKAEELFLQRDSFMSSASDGFKRRYFNSLPRRVHFTAQIDAALEELASKSWTHRGPPILDRIAVEIKATKTKIVEECRTSRDTQKEFQQMVKCKLLLVQEQCDVVQLLLLAPDIAAKQALWKSEMRFYSLEDGFAVCSCEGFTVPVGGFCTTEGFVSWEGSRENPRVINPSEASCWPKSFVIIDQACLLPEPVLRAAFEAAERTQVLLCLSTTPDRPLPEHLVTQCEQTTMPPALKVLRRAMSCRVACVINDSGARARDDQAFGSLEVEARAIAQTIFLDNFGKLVSDDRTKIRALILKHFGVDLQGVVDPSLNEMLNTAVNQASHHSFMLLPVKAEVKESCCQWLRTSAAHHGCECLPIAVRSTDGKGTVADFLVALSNTIRSMISMKNAWLVLVANEQPLDGQEEALDDFFQPLLSLLDRRKWIRLPTGEKLHFPPEARIFVLMNVSADGLSQAVTCRFRILWLDQHQIKDLEQNSLGRSASDKGS
ncbi:unnamed protein product [Polarella glacialis]|uniref:Uncharacterized protein n=1 Tax=Polarella glacialis TaxID=89957 RepID=A0A813FA75_POLGL|nr:unnamed protein product [Polarella glacialis]